MLPGRMFRGVPRLNTPGDGLLGEPAVKLVADCLIFDDGAINCRTRARRPYLCDRVEFIEPEAELPSLVPLEIIDQAPVEIPANVVP